MRAAKKVSLIPVTDVLTDLDFKEIEAEAIKKAKFVSLTQEIFELSFNKFYIEIMQEKISKKFTNG